MIKNPFTQRGRSTNPEYFIGRWIELSLIFERIEAKQEADYQWKQAYLREAREQPIPGAALPAAIFEGGVAQDNYYTVVPILIVKAFPSDQMPSSCPNRNQVWHLFLLLS